MKKAHMILSHLTNQPQFKFLKQQGCYKKYISLLGVKYQKAIAFVYIKNRTLFVAVTHPGYKMELNYNRDLLKSVLTQLSTHDDACKMLQADDVAIFHSKYHPMEQDKQGDSTVPYYNELASDTFDIKCEDNELEAKFKKIQETIACNTP